MAETAELQTAIDGLYEAFADYQRPATFVGCRCCWIGEPLPDEGGMRGCVAVRSPGGSRPVRGLTPDELEELAAQMPHLGGTVEVFMHYLPRLLEIMATVGFDDHWPSFEMVLSRLMEPGFDVCWIEWPDSEQTAVRRFLHALWPDRLALPVPVEAYDAVTIDEVLCGIGGADPDIDWYLAEWRRFDQPHAARHLEAFLATNVPTLTTRRKLDNDWWRSGRPYLSAENHNRVVAWIHDPATKDAVAAAADHPRSAAEQAALSECYLRWLP